jgi:hypothetical protein
MIGSIATFQRSPRGTTWSCGSPPLISYDPRDGAKGRGGQLGAREDRHRRGIGLLIALGARRTGARWLEASALVDGIDAAACLIARDHIRTSTFPGAVGLAAAGPPV